MKSSTLPSVRIEPTLRDEIERSLQQGESLSAFVEASVRDSVRRRQDQSEFVARGMASLAAASRSGHYVGAEAAVRKLEARLVRARATKARKTAATG